MYLNAGEGLNIPAATLLVVSGQNFSARTVTRASGWRERRKVPMIVHDQVQEKNLV